MAALTGSYEAKRKDGRLVLYPLAAGAHVFKEALVCAATATGLSVPGADAAGAVFVGVQSSAAGGDVGEHSGIDFGGSTGSDPGDLGLAGRSLLSL